MNDETNKGVSEERKTYLMLFNKIMRLEHDNAHSKDDSDKTMQDKIKKAIQTMVKVD